MAQAPDGDRSPEPRASTDLEGFGSMPSADLGLRCSRAPMRPAKFWVELSTAWAAPQIVNSSLASDLPCRKMREYGRATISSFQEGWTDYAQFPLAFGCCQQPMATDVRSTGSNWLRFEGEPAHNFADIPARLFRILQRSAHQDNRMQIVAYRR
jgi:hypothetical protein